MAVGWIDAPRIRGLGYLPHMEMAIQSHYCGWVGRSQGWEANAASFQPSREPVCQDGNCCVGAAGCINRRKYLGGLDVAVHDATAPGFRSAGSVQSPT